MRFLMISLLAALSMLTGATAHDHATATYLSNEGIMVARGDTKVLFDAFYSNSYGEYALLSDEVSAAMLAGDAPYDGIDAIFVSHVHGDHFTAAPAIAYMRAQTDVRLYGSKQVYDAIREAGVTDDDPLMARVIGYDLSPEDNPVSFNVDGLSVDVVAIPHAGGRPDIQNFSWRVTLDDQTTIMHLGDAGPVREDFERHKTHFAAKKTHAVFPPYWFFGDDVGEAILSDIIKADQATGIHVPARAAGHGDEWRAQAGGDLFTDPGETRKIGDK